MPSVSTVTVTAMPGPTWTPPPAAPSIPQAADQDARYLAALQRAGVTVTNRDSAIAAGHLYCTALRQGRTRDELKQSTLRSNPGMTGVAAADSVEAAITAYCPEQRRGE
jgi:Protein of unknown function (DUF732)